jgi:Tfp pilus assembly PilM family ATPase
MKMDLQSVLDKRRGPSELVCLDLGASSIKAVRMKRVKDQVHVLAVDTLPAISWMSADEAGRVGAIALPGSLTCNYAALCFNSEKAVVRMVNLPAHPDANHPLEAQLKDQFSLTESHRLKSVVLTSSKSRGSIRVLAAAVPDEEIRALVGMTSAGPPAAHRIELSSLATVNALLHGPGAQYRQEGLCLLDTGAHSTTIVFLNRGGLVLLRKYETGGEKLVGKIMESLDVDRETAVAMLAEGAIDLSGMVDAVLGFILRQLSISKDFVERQENCHVRRLFLGGGMSVSPVWADAVRRATDMEIQKWNPLEGLQGASDVVPDGLRGKESLFAGAVGVGLGAYGL